MITGSDGLDGGRQAARELLSSGFHPTAIICVNDFMAVGVLRELRDQGVRVPEDISVTGFDNIQLAEFCSPALTTAHIPRERIVRTILENLLSDTRSECPAGKAILIDPDLVIPIRLGQRAARDHLDSLPFKGFLPWICSPFLRVRTWFAPVLHGLLDESNLFGILDREMRVLEPSRISRLAQRRPC